MTALLELPTAKITTSAPHGLTLLAIMTPTRKAPGAPPEGSPSARLTKSLLLTSPALGPPVPTADDRGLGVPTAGDGPPATKGAALTAGGRPAPMAAGDPAAPS